jgi:hypothetical protein
MLEELWQEHKNISFPSEYGGEEVEGIDLALLDGDIAGCVETFIKQRTLDLQRTAVLGLCYRDCSVAARGLDGAAKVYFLRLERLAMLVLQSVIEVEKA